MVGDAEDLGFGRVEVQIAGVGNDNKDSGGVSKGEDKILCSNAEVVTISSDNSVVGCNGGGNVPYNGVHGEGK